MNVTIVDYNSGNISSVINSFREVAKDKVNIKVTSDLNKIKLSDKVVLPGQGSFKSCADALNKINGLSDTLNEFVINKNLISYNLIKLSIIRKPNLSLFSGWNWVPKMFSSSIAQTCFDE